MTKSAQIIGGLGPENHKAKLDLAARTRELGPDEWAVALSTTAQVGVAVMDHLDNPPVALMGYSSTMISPGDPCQILISVNIVNFSQADVYHE